MENNKFPKHFLLIRDKVYDLGDSFNLTEDLDSLYNTLSFNLPFYKTDFWSTTDLRRYDVVKLYFKFYDTATERDNANYNTNTTGFYKIFDGYIDKLQLNQSKSSGYTYTVECKSTMGLTYERSSQVSFCTADINTLITRMLNETELSQYVDNLYIDINIQGGMTFSIDSSVFVGEVLEQIKDKYVLQIYQDRASNLYVSFPSWFNNSSIKAYEYDLEETVTSIDYGDLTQAVDTVIVIGTNAVGVAFDPISYQLKQGIKVEDIDTSISPNPTKLNIRFLYRRDYYDQESCQQLAREKLIDYAKNYTITINTVFIPEQRVGENFVIKNSPKISQNQLWTIKKITSTIEKGNISSEIVGYSNSVTDFPSDILLSSSGILDTDILGITEKVEATLNLRD